MTRSSADPSIKLVFSAPLDWPAMIQFLTGRATTNTEGIDGKTYFRSVHIEDRVGWIAAAPERQCIHVEVAPSLSSVLPELQSRLQGLFDVHADPIAIDAQLRTHKLLRPLITRTPGLRVPGAISGFELALRAVLGQQVTVKAATTVFGRFVATFGARVDTPFANIDHVAPRAEAIANATHQQLIDRGLTRQRAATVGGLARAIADKKLSLDAPTDIASTKLALQAIPGIGPWTTEYIAMRALGDRDAFPYSDLALMRALNIDKPKHLLALAESWRPWRAYAAMHLWHSLANGG